MKVKEAEQKKRLRQRQTKILSDRGKYREEKRWKRREMGRNTDL